MRTFKLVKYVFSVDDDSEGPDIGDKPLAVMVRYINLPSVPPQNLVISLGDMTEMVQLVGYVINPDYPQEEGQFEILTEPILISSDELFEIHEGWMIGESDVNWLSLVLTDNAVEIDPDPLGLSDLDIEGIDLDLGE
jgi:hypothetical protein